MELKVLKTHEVSDKLWGHIVEGFNEAFDCSITADDLKSGFCTQNKLGYGYHAIALSDEGEVMGFNTFSPGFYKNGLKTVFSGSVFVRKKFRSNDLLFMDLTKALRKKAIEDGYEIELGAPNVNAENFASKILKCIHIADLNYYILPIHPSRCLNKPAFSFIDSIAPCTIKIYMAFIAMLARFCNKKEKQVKYEMEIDADFWKNRFPERLYQSFHDKAYHAYYRMYDEEGVKTAYLMDYREGNCRTSRAMLRAVDYILKNEHADAILYVGTSCVAHGALLKVPSRLVPKRLPFTYHVLDKKNKEKYADMVDVNKWNFSLMNFDVR